MSSLFLQHPTVSDSTLHSLCITTVAQMATEQTLNESKRQNTRADKAETAAATSSAMAAAEAAAAEEVGVSLALAEDRIAELVTDRAALSEQAASLAEECLQLRTSTLAAEEEASFLRGKVERLRHRRATLRTAASVLSVKMEKLRLQAVEARAEAQKTRAAAAAAGVRPSSLTDVSADNDGGSVATSSGPDPRKVLFFCFKFWEQLALNAPPQSKHGGGGGGERGAGFRGRATGPASASAGRLPGRGSASTAGSASASGGPHGGSAQGYPTAGQGYASGPRSVSSVSLRGGDLGQAMTAPPPPHTPRMGAARPASPAPPLALAAVSAPASASAPSAHHAAHHAGYAGGGYGVPAGSGAAFSGYPYASGSAPQPPYAQLSVHAQSGSGRQRPASPQSTPVRPTLAPAPAAGADGGYGHGYPARSGYSVHGSPESTPAHHGSSAGADYRGGYHGAGAGAPEGQPGYPAYPGYPSGYRPSPTQAPLASFAPSEPRTPVQQQQQQPRSPPGAQAGGARLFPSAPSSASASAPRRKASDGLIRPMIPSAAAGGSGPRRTQQQQGQPQGQRRQPPGSSVGGQDGSVEEEELLRSLTNEVPTRSHTQPAHGHTMNISHHTALRHTAHASCLRHRAFRPASLPVCSLCSTCVVCLLSTRPCCQSSAEKHVVLSLSAAPPA